MGNVVNFFFTFSASQPPPVAPQNNMWPTQESSPELCSSRLTYSIQWQCGYCKALAKWLKHSNETDDKKGLTWHTISNHQTVILNIHLPEMPKCQICPNWANEHFCKSQNWCKARFWSLNFVIQLTIRDSRGYGMGGNEIKPQTRTSLGIYKHCNVPSNL